MELVPVFIVTLISLYDLYDCFMDRFVCVYSSFCFVYIFPTVVINSLRLFLNSMVSHCFYHMLIDYLFSYYSYVKTISFLCKTATDSMTAFIALVLSFLI